MEQKPKRKRITPNGKLPVRKFKVIYPEYFGLDPATRLVFEKTPRGYKAVVNSGSFIGMPRYLIEGNKHLFQELL